jgi:SAM-dependent methyltransferase
MINTLEKRRNGAAVLNPREELIALIRGFAACPVLSGLGERGLLDRMVRGPFTAADFPEVQNPALLDATLDYLVGLGLLAADGETYSATPLGRSVFDRFGACCLIYSYREYFERLPELLFAPPDVGRPAVDRRRNVLGSGQLHARKLFPTAYRFLAGRRVDRIIDVGCGDGHFLEGFLLDNPEAAAVGVDLSETAAAATRGRFAREAPGRVGAVVADGADVAAWAAAAPPANGRTVVSLWFVVHEFTGGKPARAVEFFRRLHEHFPGAEVVLGEIVRIPPEALAAAHRGSIMPEFMLFHALSGQGVLTWEQHREVLREIPYELVNEQTFDPVAAGEGEVVPSSFIWYLRPHRNPVERVGRPIKENVG